MTHGQKIAGAMPAHAAAKALRRTCGERPAQILRPGTFIATVGGPATCFPEASSIGFRRRVRDGFGGRRVARAYRLARMNLGFRGAFAG